MAKVTQITTNFSGGELSPRLDGRVDVKKYQNGLRVLENFIVVPHGGARKRSGTRFIVEQKNNTDDVVLVNFQYNVEQAYCLIFGPSYIWFCKDQGIITHAAKNISGITAANPAVVTSASHGFSNGDRIVIQSVIGMTELNNRQFVVANATTNTFQLSGVNSSSYAAYTSGGTAAKIVELASSYTQDQIPELQFAQSNDTLYIAHQNHPIRKLTRSSHTSWTLSEPTINTGPFRTINSDRSLSITPSFSSYTITGITQANPGVVTSAAHGFVNGAIVRITGVVGMTEVNNLSFTVANATTNTFELLGVDSTRYTAYSSGGLATLAPTAYGTYPVGTDCTLTATSALFDSGMVGTIFRLNEEGDVNGIPSAAVGDMSVTIKTGSVYTNDGKVYGISDHYHSGNASWEYFNRVPNHDSGTVRVLRTKPIGEYFDSDFLHPGYCVVRITGYTSTTIVTAEIVRYQMPSSVVLNGTTFWEEGAWSDYRGYPRGIAMYEQRLMLAGSTADPTVIWGSRSGAYEDFEDGSDDNDAITYRIAAGSADVIRWLSSGRVLTAGSSLGEFAVAASNQNEALTPTNFKAVPQTSYGTSVAPPVRVNQTVLYPQRDGRTGNDAKKLREYAYDYAADSFNSTDLTIFSEHITADGFDRIGYQLAPESIIWIRRTDGVLPTCTYERAQEIVAWARQVLGGTDAEAEALAVVPGDDGDDVWLSVSRTVNGSTVKYIEVVQKPFEDDADKEDCVNLDCHLTYSGSSTSTITGLWHLRGEAVKVLNNGSVETGTVSATGALTLTRATTKACIGYGYTAILETQDLEAGAQAGTAQSRAKRISQVYVRVLNSLGGTVGPDSSNQKTILYRTPADVMGSSAALRSGLIENDFSGGWDKLARIRIEHSDPFPFHVTGIVAELNTNG